MNWFARLFGIIAQEISPPLESGKRPVPAYLMDAAWQQFNMHWAALDVLDQKASSILSAIGVIIALLVTLQPQRTTCSWWPDIVFFVGLLALVMSAIFALLSYRVRNYTILPKPLNLYEWYQDPDVDNPEIDTAAMLIRQINGAIEDNKPVMSKKVILLAHAHWSLIAGIILVALRACMN